MSIGPVELLVLKFPGNQFTGEVGPALKELVDSGTIRIIDLLFAITDPQGNIAVVELSDLDSAAKGEFDPVVTDQTDLLTHDDARTLAAGLGPDSSGAIMLFENTWATKFRDAVLGAGGELVLSERIPKAAVDAMVDSAA
jgi:hypothetical protein